MSITVTSNDAPEQVVETSPEPVAEKPAEKVEAASPAEESAEEQVEEKPEQEQNDDEAEGDEEKDVEAGESQKKSGKTRNRIQKLRARAQALEQELMELRAKSAMPNEAESVSADDNSGRPNPDNFETEEDYQDALAEWRVDQKLAAREQKAKSEKLSSEFQARVQTHREKTAAFAKQHADFEDVIESVSDIVLTPIVQDAILENGPEFMYELAKNPEELERINELSAFEAARALGRIEERIAAKAAKPKEEKKIQSKAPQPINPTRSGAGTGAHKSVYDDTLSFKDYEKLRAEGLR